MPGRKRSKPTNGGENDERRRARSRNGRSPNEPVRPPPPPPPPASLVRLLKSDREVLSYFQSLQGNLEADVAIWKHRANKWKTENEKLTAQLKQRPKDKTESNLRQRKSNTKNDKAAKQKPAKNGRVKDTNCTTFDARAKNYKERESTPENKAAKKKPAKNGRFKDPPARPASDTPRDGESIPDNLFEVLSESSVSDLDDNEVLDEAPRVTEDSRVHAVDKAEANDTGFELESSSSSSLKDLDGEEVLDEKRRDINASSAPAGDSAEAHGTGLFELESSFSSSSNDNKHDSRKARDDRNIMGGETGAHPDESHRLRNGSDGEEVPDDMFELDSDSSGDESCSEDGGNREAEQPLSPREATNGNALPRTQFHRTKVFNILREAYLGLGRLGIPLIDVVAIEEQDDRCAHEPTEEETASKDGERVKRPCATKIRPRSDEHVAADLYYAIKTLTRLHLNEKQLAKGFPPFDVNLVPCCNPSPVPAHEKSSATDELSHPAVEAKRLIFRCLVVLDTFCGISTSNEQWNRYFVDDGPAQQGIESQEKEYIKIGLRGRKRLVNRIMQSLDGEISEAWAGMDRSAFLTTEALHFVDEPAKEEEPLSKPSETVEPHSLIGGSKSQARLSTVVERCWLGQLIVALYLSRNDPQSCARMVLRYVLSTMPALAVEDHPRLPPTLSLVALEGMLHPDPGMFWWREDEFQGHPKESWFIACLRNMMNGDSNDVTMPMLTGCSLSQRDDSKLGPCEILDNARASMVTPDTDQDVIHETVGHSLALCIDTVASIWRERLASKDDRISSIARVEVSSHKRLLAANDKWLEIEKTTRNHKKMGSGLLDRTSSLIDEMRGNLCGKSNAKVVMMSGLALELLLILRGEVNDTGEDYDKALDCCSASCDQSQNFQALAPISARAYRQIAIRRLDRYREQVGTAVAASDLYFSLKHVVELEKLNEVDASKQPPVLTTSLICCALLADGAAAYEILQHLEGKVRDLNDAVGTTDKKMRNLCAVVRKVGDIPVVRVINLERRSDRLCAFMAQAVRDRILVVRGVVDLQNNDKDAKDGYYFGCYACDGRGRLAEAHERLVEYVGSVSKLEALVQSHWHPNLLKPFDRDAPDEDVTVRLSPSECACAISHIASWKGVIRSLQHAELPHWSLENEFDPDNSFRRWTRLRRLYRISGFAEGVTMLTENSNMPLTPVCVILEDDAVLVDRFVDRLRALLKELPRDFHFCSLGYSRPKTAPIVPFSEHLGIPTCQWYLTGYILSLAGAEHLNQSLPVVGPVDSWIGLKMTSNWDNVYGEALGVGGKPRPLPDLPSRKDLGRMLRFRAFCALQPLCSQKVGALTGPGSSASDGRSWRERDTDIDYSGDL